MSLQTSASKGTFTGLLGIFAKTEVCTTFLMGSFDTPRSGSCNLGVSK